MSKRMFLSPPHMGGEEFTFVKEAFDTNWLAPVGPHLNAFEEEFCQITEAKAAAAVSSGTAALHLALRLAGVTAGDEVICSTLTFVASANPILYQGATPVFIDSETESWNMNPVLLQEELTKRAKIGKLPKAVVLVHLYGQSADIEPILQTCQQYNIPLIEDAAEALGATYKGKMPGTFGKFGIYSFNGNKIITTTGGGMLVSDDEEAIQKARFWATQARDRAPHYQHSESGYNYRLSNVLAGIGRGQLRVLKDRVAARRRNFEVYHKTLSRLPGIKFMPEASFGQSSRWLTCLKVDPAESGVDQEKIRTTLEQHNIESRPVWKPLHLQPLFKDCACVGGSVAEDLFEKGLCLPSGSSMTDDDLNRVIEIILDLY
ncbi:putative PLP-dependent enzyme possibly involved in cell wall biogenesis [Rivularia sp. PCC 7116]|uniref:DegT/DnrJ/EryC1/StrS family aminotransferase n=1 Tax=Rivularia sp. PCC 7116 TaxID=373994 RepID=UPI00029ED26A|nr:DegT/DnrJ/EryC1/StrS family aminotransferase [Rivularia sp. PCC 7116]AFY54690.1 putative PLP-dependent enzyme possibly involved in cell wall biogenesis [Rivularia sp. PCC 7116]